MPKPVIIEAVLTSALAVYCVKRGRTFIVVDKRLTRREKKCAIAHELGHDQNQGLPYHMEPKNEYERIITARAEHRADRWAAKKLIPDDALEEFISRHKTATAHDLAEYFDVTERVAEFRIELWKNTSYTPG